jgi:hypothetical protein
MRRRRRQCRQRRHNPCLATALHAPNTTRIASLMPTAICSAPATFIFRALCLGGIHTLGISVCARTHTRVPLSVWVDMLARVSSSVWVGMRVRSRAHKKPRAGGAAQANAASISSKRRRLLDMLCSQLEIERMGGWVGGREGGRSCTDQNTREPRARHACETRRAHAPRPRPPGFDTPAPPAAPYP